MANCWRLIDSGASGCGTVACASLPSSPSARDDPRMSMRAAGIEAFGADVALLDLPEPPAFGAGQVLIEVKAAGVGNWEEFVRTGQWDVGRAPPLALGVEAAGEVVEVGPGVEWPAVGAAVMT